MILWLNIRPFAVLLRLRVESESVNIIVWYFSALLLAEVLPKANYIALLLRLTGVMDGAYLFQRFPGLESLVDGSFSSGAGSPERRQLESRKETGVSRVVRVETSWGMCRRKRSRFFSSHARSQLQQIHGCDPLPARTTKLANAFALPRHDRVLMSSARARLNSSHPSTATAFEPGVENWTHRSRMDSFRL